MLERLHTVQMLCVFEYLPNGDLEKYLRQEKGRDDGKPRRMGWNLHGRFVAVDVAQGLAFLHARKVCWSTILSELFTS